MEEGWYQVKRPGSVIRLSARKVPKALLYEAVIRRELRRRRAPSRRALRNVI